MNIFENGRKKMNILKPVSKKWLGKDEYFRKWSEKDEYFETGFKKK